MACRPWFLLFLAVTAWGQDPIARFPQLPPGTASITVMDRQGRFVGRIQPSRRTWVTLDRIPAFLRQALLAVEDARFYEHGGIDLKGIARALVRDVTHGRMAEGGSTITQQLIKNRFLSNERTLDRKLQEARMAMDFEKKYSKDQILEMYFNEIYFGNGAWGLAQAARLYFDKNPEALTEAECLLLAGVPKNPGRYNPLGKPADVALRRDVVLKRLEELGYVSAARKQDFWRHPAAVQPLPQAPSYLAQVRAQLATELGEDAVERGGLEVFAALDLELQKAAERTLREGVKRLSPDLQGALVALDPLTGDVLAAVGDAEGQARSLNRAFTSRRQPGSAIKPLLYATAVDQGLTATSRWNDDPVAYPGAGGRPWKPRNFAGEHLEDPTLAEALAHSSNVVAVKVLDRVGLPAFVEAAGRMGLPLRAANGLSLALGTSEVTLKDLVQAYTPLANPGNLAQARTILRTHDLRTGAWVEHAPSVQAVFNPAACFVTAWMMQDVLLHGTAKALRTFAQEHPCAGKTGTTEDQQDAWFVGFTPHLAAGVWVGFDRPRPGGRGFTGGAVAAPIWERFMRKAVGHAEPEPFQAPEGAVQVTVDPASGQVATDACPATAEAWFVAGTEPQTPCPLHAPQAPETQPVP
ncbi:transglycosylase domain-containing protein [Mesoterricola sediminis]|uniref:Penicillin-binding protein 1A n=1 Tax=Mesoterricola sediminis TaxID=2927980 RepID=A0AA48H1V5_9BACT|nr:PBP1A family penicillin-binding protein [Mesoterricola sediminis]BDU78092.1 penicillin-binding protein 1A [Mesoterricola sediminis]